MIKSARNSNIREEINKIQEEIASAKEYNDSDYHVNYVWEVTNEKNI